MKFRINRANWMALILGLLVVALPLAACGAPVEEEDAVRAAAPASATAGSPAEEKVTEPADLVAAQLQPTATTAIQAQATKAMSPAPTPSATPVDSPPTQVGGARPAPDFRLPDPEGKMWTLSHFRGQPVMLFYWATW